MAYDRQKALVSRPPTGSRYWLKFRATRNCGLKFGQGIWANLALENVDLETDEAARLRNSSQLPQIVLRGDNVSFFSSDVSVWKELW